MINWINVKDGMPPVHEADWYGDKYMTSSQLLLCTTNKEKPVAMGTLEDGKWFIEGFVQENIAVTHWAHINLPDGHLL